MAFMCIIGSGVSIRSTPGRTSQRPPTCVYQRPAAGKYSFGSTQPFGRPVVPEV